LYYPLVAITAEVSCCVVTKLKNMPCFVISGSCVPIYGVAGVLVAAVDAGNALDAVGGNPLHSIPPFACT
jgi:hypothetical protein